MAGPTRLGAMMDTDEKKMLEMARNEMLEMAKDKIFAKRGDVLLQPSKDGQLVGTLLVSSHALSLASPVFEAMFNGNFSEGQELSAASPRKVALPEDDPEALILLCRITHMQIDDVPDQVSPEKLADFAILCDKYQCLTAVRSWSKVQIAQLLPNPNAARFSKLVFITYLLDLPVEFEKVSVCMIRDRAGGFNFPDMTHGTDFLPLVMIEYLRAIQNTSISAARRALMPKKVLDLLDSPCRKAGDTMKEYLSALKHTGIPLTRNLSLAEYASRAPGLKHQSLSFPCTEHIDCAVARNKNMITEVYLALQKAYNDVKPCCLDCTRRNICGEKGVVCRLGHDSLAVADSNSPP